MMRLLSSARVARVFAVVVARSTMVAAIFVSTQAAAQRVAPSQVTPQSLRPEAAPGAAIALPGAAGLTAPANAAALSLTLGGVSIEGGLPELRGESDAIVGRLSGRRVTVADIYAAANALEQAYAAAGYILVRVVVPPQRLAGGATLRLVLVDGFVEAVDVKGVPESQRELVKARMSGIVGKRHVTLAEIERRLLLASDIPGLSLRSTLSRGATPGGTLLVLEGTQNFVTGSAGVDNRLPNSLGIFELNSSAALNSAFGYASRSMFRALRAIILARRLTALRRCRFSAAASFCLLASTASRSIPNTPIRSRGRSRRRARPSASAISSASI